MMVAMTNKLPPRKAPAVVRELVIIVDEFGYLSEHAFPHTDYTLRIVADGKEPPTGPSWDRLAWVASWAQAVFVLGGLYAADLISQRLPSAIAQVIATDGYSWDLTGAEPLPGF